jgi:hypothetical protein
MFNDHGGHGDQPYVKSMCSDPSGHGDQLYVRNMCSDLGVVQENHRQINSL